MNKLIFTSQFTRQFQATEDIFWGTVTEHHIRGSDLKGNII